MSMTVLQHVQTRDFLSRGGLIFAVAQVDLGTYATNGILLAREDIIGVGGDIKGVFVIAQNGGYVYEYIPSTGKLKMYRSAGFTPSGTIAVSMTDGSRVTSYAPGGGDIKGSANTDVGIASGTLPTNGNLLSTLAASNNTTAFTLALQPDVSRNVSISHKNTNVGASTGNAVTHVITGTYRGAAQTENISFSALELTSTAQNEVATKYGSKPFDTITSITNPTAQPSGWEHAAGPGSKLGLPSLLDTPAEADVLKITVNAANMSPSGIVSTTNNTVNVGAISDNADVGIVYTEDYDGAAGTAAFTGTAVIAGALVEVANGVSLTAVDPTLFVIAT